MTRISVAVMVRNEREYIRECLISALPIADEVVVVLDPTSYDKTEGMVRSILQMYYKDNHKIISHKWKSGAKQKQFLKEQCSGDWILFLDGDEILGDNAELLRQLLKDKPEFDSFSIRSHHFIYNLRFEDASKEKHYHYARLVKNTEEVYFEGENHAIIKGIKKLGAVENIRIYHMGYVKQLQKIMDKYELDSVIQQLHTMDFLDNWKDAHVLGAYPIKEFPKEELPGIIRNKFNIDLDKYYFQNRGVEAKQ